MTKVHSGMSDEEAAAAVIKFAEEQSKLEVPKDKNDDLLIPPAPRNIRVSREWIDSDSGEPVIVLSVEQKEAIKEEVQRWIGWGTYCIQFDDESTVDDFVEAIAVRIVSGEGKDK